jgi:hypothetical protein
MNWPRQEGHGRTLGCIPIGLQLDTRPIGPK